MSPAQLYEANSRVKKTNSLYDRSVCPNDLILLSCADTAGKGFRCERKTTLREWCFDRLNVYNERMKQPQVGGKDLMNLGLKPSPMFSELISKAHQLHLSGVDKEAVLKDFKTKLMKSGVLPKESAEEIHRNRVKELDEKFGNLTDEHQSDIEYE